MRGGDNLSSIYWLYNRTGEAFLLDVAQKIHRNTANWGMKGTLPNWHNVNVAQCFKEPAIYFQQSHSQEDLEAAYENFRVIREQYGQMPGGMFAADENARKGHDGPFFLMNPFSSRCCQHNHSHGWPYFAEHLWFATPDNGVAAVLYSASMVTARVGKGVLVSITEETEYPFGEEIALKVSAPEAVRFPLYLRIPGWCEEPLVSVNGEDLNISAGTVPYIRLEKRWTDGDTVNLRFPMKIKVHRWVKNHNSASVNRGPLTYSLKIGEEYLKRSSAETAIGDSRWQDGVDKELWPAWEIHPTTPWNFGLLLDREEPASSFKVVRRGWPVDNMPFSHEGVPVELIAQGKRIPGWTLDEHKLAGELRDSPVKSSEPVESISLIPMGAARLRISAFPVIGEGADALEWAESP